jgi:hypothetical protein
MLSATAAFSIAGAFTFEIFLAVRDSKNNNLPNRKTYA